MIVNHPWNIEIELLISENELVDTDGNEAGFK